MKNEDDYRQTAEPGQTTSFLIALVAAIIFGVGILLGDGGGLAGISLASFFFFLRAISKSFLYFVMAFSVVVHLIAYISPEAAGLIRNEVDLQFGQFMAGLNLLILVPWFINLSVIRYGAEKKAFVAEVVGSLGAALLALVFAGLNFTTANYYKDMPIRYFEEFELPLMIAALLVIEAFLFLRLAWHRK